MKKLLALVLALVMTLSLCVTSNAAFTDADKVNETYAEAVDVLNGLGVFKGYEDGSFKPEGNITRAEVAAIVYRLYTGDVKDKQAGLYAGYGKFDDMALAQWAAGYVGFCANAGFIKGYGNGKFGPSDSVTGYQALAMILRAVGYGKNGEFEGAEWELHVAQVAQQLEVLKNVKAVSLRDAASRQLVAELLFQVAANVDTVSYTPAFGYVKNTVVEEDDETLGEKNFDLAKVEGVVIAVDYKNGKTTFAQEWDEDEVVVAVVSETKADMKWIGYAAHTWTIEGSKESAAVDAITDVYLDGESLGTCADGTDFATLTDDDEDDFIAKLDADDDTIDGEAALLFVNGEWVDDVDWDGFDFDDLNLDYGKGVYVDFVDNDGKGEAEAIVILDYTVDVVTAVNDGTSTGKNDKADNSVIFEDEGEVETKYIVTEDELDVDDLVTYIKYGVNDNDYYYVIKATTVTSKYTEYDKDGIYTVGDKEYENAEDVLDELDTTPDDETYKLWLDPFGYILDVEEVTDPDQYLFVMSNEDTESNDKTVEAVVAFADGTTKKVLINKIDGTKVSIMSSLDDDELANEIYTYTESDGKYAITPAGAEYTDAAYETNDRTWDDADVTLETVVVDLRDYEKVGDKGEVKTGYKNIPTVDRDVELYYVTDEDDGGMVVGFLLDGETAKKYDAASFVVFNTSVTEKATKTSKVDTTAYTLKKGVIENNKLVENYSLGVEDNDTVDNEAYKYLDNNGYGVADTGVGFYYFNKSGELKNYISFAEEVGAFEWNKTTGVNKFDGERMYNWDLPENYWLLDIDDGKATSYKLGKSGELENAFILMASDSDSDITKDSKDSIVAIFVLKDANEAPATGTASEYTKPIEGGTRYFYAADGMVTSFVNVYDVPVYDITVVNNIEGYNAAGELVKPVEYTLEVNGVEVTEDEAEAKEGDTVTLTLAPAAGFQDNFTAYVTLNGDVKKLTEDSNVYTFTMPDEDVTLAITGVDPDLQVLTVKTAGNYMFTSPVTYDSAWGTMQLTTWGTWVVYGADFSFEVVDVANDGKSVASVKANGVALTAGEDGVYTIENVTADTTIEVTLETNTWNQVIVKYVNNKGEALQGDSTYNNVTATRNDLWANQNSKGEKVYSVPTGDKYGTYLANPWVLVDVNETAKTATVTLVYFKTEDAPVLYDGFVVTKAPAPANAGKDDKVEEKSTLTITLTKDKEAVTIPGFNAVFTVYTANNGQGNDPKPNANGVEGHFVNGTTATVTGDFGGNPHSWVFLTIGGKTFKAEIAQPK